MTWTINASGTKAECEAQIAASSPLTDATNERQRQRMITVVLQEIGRYPDGSTISVSCVGHAVGDEGGNRTTRIEISGTAPAKKLPPVTGTLNLSQLADTKVP